MLLYLLCHLIRDIGKFISVSLVICLLLQKLIGSRFVYMLYAVRSVRKVIHSPEPFE